MGDMGKLEQLWISVKHKFLCLFGHHDFDVYEALYFSYEAQPEPGRFFVSGCGWCGCLKYGAHERQESK